MEKDRKLRAAALLAAALAVAGAPARAQVGTWDLERGPAPAERGTAGKWSLSYNPGYSFPEGPDAASKQPSFAAQVALDYQIYEFLAGGMEIGYSFGHKLKGVLSGRYVGDVDGDGKPDYLSFDSDVKVKVLQVTPMIRIGKVFGRTENGRWRARHVLELGAGYYHWESNEGTFSLTGKTSNGTVLNQSPLRFWRASSDNFGMNFGTALDFEVMEGLSLGADFRYHILLGPPNSIRYIIPAARITFLF